MKYLTEAEFNALHAAARANEINTPADVLCAAKKLAADARRVGVVLRIEQTPLLPLAMGNHGDTITVSEVRR